MNLKKSMTSSPQKMGRGGMEGEEMVNLIRETEIIKKGNKWKL